MEQPGSAGVQLDSKQAEDRNGSHQDRKKDRRHRGNANAQNFAHRKDFVKERLEYISGPSTNLPIKKDTGPKKFSGRCRLFVGNLPSSITEPEFKKMFNAFGEVAEVFLQREKGFGFIKLDTRENAEAAKAALDFSVKDGKHLRVRFASHGAALKVKNLSPWVSNELLETAFSIFGDVERAVVIVDDRCRPVGEGIVEYSRKQSAQLALKRCSEGCFLLTSSPRPIIVEPFEQRDEEDGLSEKKMQRNNKEYLKEREIGPRLAEYGSFEYEFSNRWKKLFELEQQKRDNLEKEIEEGRQALDKQMAWAIHEHEEKLLRERLRHIEEQTNLLQRERQMQMEEEMRRAEERRQHELMLRQQQEEILQGRTGEDMHMRADNMALQGTAMHPMGGASGMSPALTSEHMGKASVAGSYGAGNIANGMITGTGINMPMHYSQNDYPPMGPNYIQGNASHLMGVNGPGNSPHGMSPQMDNTSGYQNKRRRY